MKTIKISAPHGHMGVWSHEENEWAKEIRIGEYVFTTAKSAGEVDGMICWWEFTQEFLDYKGPRVFYCCEPSFYFRGWRSVKRELRSRLRSLRMDEFAWHYHPHPEMRVVHESFSLLSSEIPEAPVRFKKSGGDSRESWAPDFPKCWSSEAPSLYSPKRLRHLWSEDGLEKFSIGILFGIWISGDIPR